MSEPRELAAFVRLMLRVVPSYNGVGTVSPLYCLEVSAGGASGLVPEGVSETAALVAYTDAVLSFSAESMQTLSQVSAAKYAELVRVGTRAPVITPAFVDEQHRLYMTMLLSSYDAVAAIVLELEHDGYSLASTAHAICSADGQSSLEGTRSAVRSSLLSYKDEPTMVYKTLQQELVNEARDTEDVLSDMGKVEGLGLHTMKTWSGHEPMFVWAGAWQLLGRRMPVTNHGQKLTNVGQCLHLTPVMQAVKQYVPIPVVREENGTLTVEADVAFDEDDAVDVLAPQLLQTHHSHTFNNCIDPGKASRRLQLLAFCRELDDATCQYEPVGFCATLMHQRPTGIGEPMINLKVAGVLYMLSYTHAAGDGIALDELYWHIIRTGSASKTGEFPKTTDKPIKSVFVVVLYSVVGYLSPSASSAPRLAAAWNTFVEWAAEANVVRQKEQFHHDVWYAFIQLLCRGRDKLRLQLRPGVARTALEPYTAFIEDDWNSKVGDNDIAAAFQGADAVSVLTAASKLHCSLDTICAPGLSASIIGGVLAGRAQQAARVAVCTGTHAEGLVSTFGSAMFAALASLPLQFGSDAWALMQSAVEQVCGPAILPGFNAHPLATLIHREVTTQKLVLLDGLTDRLEVWPVAAAKGGECPYDVYVCPGSACIIAARHLPPPIHGFTLAPFQLVLRTASFAPDVYSCIMLVPPTGARPPCGQSMTEDDVFGHMCDNEGLCAGVILSAAFPRAGPSGLSLPHELLCRRYIRVLRRPCVSGGNVLLLSTVAEAGILHIDSRGTQFQFTVILPAPITGADDKTSIRFFFLVFDASDKNVKVYEAPQVPIEAVISGVDPAAPLDKRRDAMRSFAMQRLFPEARRWDGMPAKSKGGRTKALAQPVVYADNWERIRAEAGHMHFGNLVRDAASVIGLLKILLSGVAEHALFEGVLQWGGALRSFFGLKLDRDDDTFWGFIKIKEEQLTRLSSKYSVSVAGHKRVMAALSDVNAKRLAHAENLAELQFYSDNSEADRFEISRVRGAVKRLRDQSDAMGAIEKRIKGALNA